MTKRRTTGIENNWKEMGIGAEETLDGPKVLKSAAGYYIGYLYWDVECEAWLPWSRDSIYFPTEQSAQDYLTCYPEEF